MSAATRSADAGGAFRRAGSMDGLAMEAPGPKEGGDGDCVGFDSADLPRTSSEMSDDGRGPGGGGKDTALKDIDLKAGVLLQRRGGNGASPPLKARRNLVQASPLLRVAVLAPRPGAEGWTQPQRLSVSSEESPSRDVSPLAPTQGRLPQAWSPPSPFPARSRAPPGSPSPFGNKQPSSSPRAASRRGGWNRDAQLSRNSTPRRAWGGVDSPRNAPSSPILNTRKLLLWPNSPSETMPAEGGFAPVRRRSKGALFAFSNEPSTPTGGAARGRARGDGLQRVEERRLLAPPVVGLSWLGLPRSIAHPCVSGKIAEKLGRVRGKGSIAMQAVMVLCVVMCALCVTHMAMVDTCAPGSRLLEQGLCN